MNAQTATASGIVSSLLDFCRHAEDCMCAAHAPREVFADLKSTVEMRHQELPDSVRAEVLCAPEVERISLSLPTLVRKLETELEKTEAAERLKDSAGLDSFLFMDKYRGLAAKEWLLCQRLFDAENLKNKRFMFVGCGAMPMTAVCMAQAQGVHVDCCDIDCEACSLARSVVDAAGVGDKVRILHLDGRKVDYEGYDIVIVANLAHPQMDILRRIGRTSSVQGMIARRANGLVTLMYSSCDPRLMAEAGFEEVSIADPNDRRSVHLSQLFGRIKAQNGIFAG